MFRFCNSCTYLVNFADMEPLPPRKQRHPFLRYQGLEYSDMDIADFEEWLERIHDRDTHRVLLDLNAPSTIQFQLGEARRRRSWRQFILALGLHTAEEMELLGFARTSPSYTLIRDPVLRLCYRMMAHSIAGRSQAPKKVSVIDLFYLKGLDVRSVNIPYLLARYLRRFAARRKSGALISGGQFVARLAEHFGILTKKRLKGLTVIALTLSVIDMAELVRLQIYEEIDDTWTSVALGPERQPDVVAGAPGVAEDAPTVDEGVQADPAPIQAP
ncbi:hypothetical protein Tco_0273994 [Tanacetum coccineum]